jgi:hypothetical protein
MSTLRKIILHIFAIITGIWGLSVPVSAQVSIGNVSGHGAGIEIIFGEQQINTTTIYTVTVTADTTVKFANPAVVTSTLSGTPFTVAAGDDGCAGKDFTGGAGTCTIAVRFTPTSETAFASYFRVATTAPSGYPGVFVNLHGIGISGGASQSGSLNISPSSGFTISAAVGDIPTQVLSLSATGGNVSMSGLALPDGWVANNLCGTSVRPGYACVIMLYPEVPAKAGTYPYKVVIQASDKAHILDVTLNVSETSAGTQGTIAIAPNVLDFGALRPGTKLIKTVTVTASGGSVSFTGLEVPTGFASFHSCGNLIPAGGSCTAAITFSPTEKVSYEGSAVFNSSAQGAPHFVRLLGSGSGTTSGSTGTTSTTPLMVIDDAFLDFGEWAIGTNQQKSIGIHNRGGGTLSASLSITGQSFAVDTSGCGSSGSISLAAAASCDLVVKFAPQELGTLTGTITFSGDGTENAQIDLKGEGTGAGQGVSGSGFAVSATQLTFGSVSVGSSAVKPLTLTASSGTRPAIASVTAPDGYSATHDCTTAANSSCTVTLAFAPQTEAAYQGMLVITATDGSAAFVTVNGQGSTAAQMSARTLGNRDAFDLTGLFRFAGEQASSAGKLYAAFLYQNELFFLSAGQWAPYVANSEPPAYTSVGAETNEITILVGQDMRALSGGVVILGYGQNINEVVSKHQYTPVYVVE